MEDDFVAVKALKFHNSAFLRTLGGHDRESLFKRDLD
jgi:hypothetical protein